MENATRVTASTIGVICGISGLEHGFFEVIQGYVPAVFHMISGKPLIYAIGDANRFWRYGFEYAYTVIPNYLMTGILALVISTLVIIWSAGFMQRKVGWLVFILLSMIQYLVGGGAAQLGPAILVGPKTLQTRVALLNGAQCVGAQLVGAQCVNAHGLTFHQKRSCLVSDCQSIPSRGRHSAG